MRLRSALLGLLACASCTSLNDGAADRLYGKAGLAGEAGENGGTAGDPSGSGGTGQCSGASCSGGCGGGSACPGRIVQHAPPCSDSEKECSEVCVAPSIDNGCRGTACDPCPAPANGTAACVADVCGVLCDLGFVQLGDACVAPPPSCMDKNTNGTETDVDCGGQCSRCPGGKACQVGADCISAACVNALCATQACDNGVQDSMETDIDCGGPQCVPCHVGKRCGIDADCFDGTCTDSKCRSAMCSDNTQNGTETGTDCGGDCEPCPLNNVCNIDADCASGHCIESICRAPCGAVNTADGCAMCKGYASCCRTDNYCGCKINGVICY